MGINVFTASGNVGSDMEVRVTPNGKSIGNFNIPVETGYGDNKKTAWVTCKMFGDRADKLQHYIKKGSQVTVTGAFSIDEWEKDGVKHSRPCILVNDVQLPRKNDAQPQPQQPQPQPQQHGGWGGQQQQNAPRQNMQAVNQDPIMDFDSDIPF